MQNEFYPPLRRALRNEKIKTENKLFVYMMMLKKFLQQKDNLKVILPYSSFFYFFAKLQGFYLFFQQTLKK